MVNWKRTRNWKNSAELEKEIQKFFEKHNWYSIEMLYHELGVSKQNVYDWGKAKSFTQNKWHKIIGEAKEFIHSYLAHEMTVEENSTKLKSRTMYMRSRYKDNWEAETNDTSESKITINLVNEGNNAIK